MNKAESKYFSTAARMDEALIECLEKKDLEYITVKEICEKAGVNRSTFYLHYETIGDLLNECVEYTNKKCFKKFSPELTDVKKRLSSENIKDYIFISPEYLKPFFEFVRENKRLFKVVLLNPLVFDTEKTFIKLFDEVFSPAMDKFEIEKQQKPYVIHFYLGGIISVVKEWIKNNCADTIEDITEICMFCIAPSGIEGGLENRRRDLK